jgi:hypothetical protein
MQMDTRRLTVARDHLQIAYDELTGCKGQTEGSMVRAALERGIDQLNLVLRKLQEQIDQGERSPILDDVEAAYEAAHRAWQGAHNLLNDWPPSSGPAVGSLAEEARRALLRVESARVHGEAGAAMHA